MLTQREVRESAAVIWLVLSGIVGFTVALVVVIGGWRGIQHAVGWDERTTAELSLAVWAAAGKREIAWSECYDEHPRPKDGRARCSVQFADSAIQHTVWCAGDHAHEKGCGWF